MIEPKLRDGIRSHLPLIGALVGLGGWLAMRSRLGHRKPRRLTAEQLMSLDSAAFEEFIHRTRLKTISTSRPDPVGGNSD